jgi:hypothetical protein
MGWVVDVLVLDSCTCCQIAGAQGDTLLSQVVVLVLSMCWCSIFTSVCALCAGAHFIVARFHNYWCAGGQCVDALFPRVDALFPRVDALFPRAGAL